VLPFIWGNPMEGVPPSADILLMGFIAFGLAVAMLITGIQGAVRFVRRRRDRAPRNSGF
jgi:hypothetical protein